MVERNAKALLPNSETCAHILMSNSVDVVDQPIRYTTHITTLPFPKEVQHLNKVPYHQTTYELVMSSSLPDVRL